MDFWWIAPGVILVVVSLVIRFLHIGLVAAHRPNKRLVLFSLRLRQIGMGLTFAGLGAGILVRAMTNGPDVGSIVLGALIVGMAGLYFIAAGDPMFKTGIITVPQHWTRRPPESATEEETLESKAKRLHELVHPEDASQSRSDQD